MANGGTAFELAEGYISLSVSTKDVGRTIVKSFAGAGTAADKAGRDAGKKFAKAFDANAADASQLETLQERAAAAAQESSRKVANAREVERRATSQVQIAETRLNEVRNDGKSTASKVMAAEEKLRQAQVKQTIAVEKLQSETAKAQREQDEFAHAMANATQQTRQQENAWQRLARKMRDKITGKVNIDVDDSQQKEASAKLAILSRNRRVDLLPEVSKAAAVKATAALSALSGFSSISKSMKSLQAGITGILSDLPRLSVLATTIGGVGLSAASAGVNVLSLASSLASVAPAALALPGILGGLTAGTIATVVAFKDIQNVLPDVSKQFMGLQKVISGKFWAQAAGPIRSLAGQVLPELRKGLGVTSTALGSFFAKLATAFKGRLVPDLAPMFANLAKSINIASGAAGGMAGILSTLGKRGSQYLPSLAKGFANLTNRFDAFLTKADKSGELTDWINTGIDALKQLGRVAAGAFNTVSGLAKAASKAGGSTLKGLADSLQHVADVVNAPDFQKSLVGAFAGIQTAAKQVTTIAGPAVENFFKTILGTASKVLPNIGVAFGTLVKGIATALSSPVLQKGILAISQGLVKGLQAAAPFFGVIGDAVGYLMQALAPIIATVLPIFAQLLGVVGKVLKAMMPIITSVTDTFSQLAAAILPVLATVATQVVTALTPLVTALMPTLLQVVQALLPAFIPIVQQLLPAMVKVLVAALPVLVPFAKYLSELAIRVVPALVQVLNIAVPVIEVLVTVLSKVFTAATSALKGTAKFGTGMSQMQSLGALVHNWFSGVFLPFFTKTIPDNFKLMVKVVVSVFTGWKNTVVSIARAIGNGIISVFKSWTSTVAKVVRAVVSTVVKVWRGFLATMTSVAKSIANAVGKAFNSMRSGVTNAVRALVNAAVKVWNGFRNTLTKVANSIRNGVSTAFNVLKSRVSGAVSTLVSSVTKRWNSFRTTVSNVAGNLRDRVSNAFNSLKSRVTNTIAAVVSGINKRWSSFRTSIGNISDNLRGRVSNAFSKMRTGVTNTFGKMVSGVSTAWSKLKSVIGKPIIASISAINTGLIKGGINWILNKLGVAKNKQLPWIPVPKFAAGGGVKGSSAWQRGGTDRIPAMLDHDEFVVKKKSAKKVGYDVLNYVNDTGMLPPGYAKGGRVWPTNTRNLSPSYPGHSGVDIAASQGAPIYAPEPGQIAYTGWGHGYGQAIFERFANGVQAVFGHTSKLLVKAGQSVAAGQQIGKVGATGHATGPHLHFEVNVPGPFGASADRAKSLDYLHGASVGGGSGGIGGVLSDALGFLKGLSPVDWLLKKASAVSSKITGGGILSEGLKKIPGLLVSKGKDWITNKIGDIAGAANPGGSGVERWRGTIIEALKANGLPTSSAMVNAWLKQVQSESGGNPGITQQIHDVNSGGNEARGLLQVIPPTFNAYKFPGHGNITNGLDNALAAIHYAKSRYGSNMLGVIGHGHGYATGTIGAQPGMRWVGERGPELVNFKGGERVFNARQSASMSGPGGNTTINVDHMGADADEVAYKLDRMKRQRLAARGLAYV